MEEIKAVHTEEGGSRLNTCIQFFSLLQPHQKHSKGIFFFFLRHKSTRSGQGGCRGDRIGNKSNMTLETGRKKDDLAALKTLNPKPTVEKVENQSNLP